MNDIPKIIEKIQKLLALSKSPNEHEAALAAEKAQELLATYNIDVSEVEAEEAKTSVTEDTVISKRRAWQRVVRAATARMYFCEYYYGDHVEEAPHRKRGYARLYRHYYVGESQNIAVAKMMSEYLIATVWRLAREGAHAQPKRERNRYRKSFANACTDRLSTRILERIVELSETSITTHEGTNLPALASLCNQKKASNETFIEAHVGELGSGRGRRRSSHFDGIIEGREAGESKSISLDTQIGAGKETNHLIGNK